MSARPHTLELFSCERFSARLTPRACALNYAQREDARKTCRGCPIGEAHAAGRSYGQLLHEVGVQTHPCDTPGCGGKVIAVMGSAIGVGRHHFCDPCKARRRAAATRPERPVRPTYEPPPKPCKTPGCKRPLRQRKGNVKYCDECKAERKAAAARR